MLRQRRRPYHYTYNSSQCLCVYRLEQLINIKTFFLNIFKTSNKSPARLFLLGELEFLSNQD